MAKNIRPVLCLLLATAAPGFALSEPALDSEAMAKLQSALDFCSQRNPAAADRYQEQAKRFTQGATEDEVAQLRASEDYKSAYESGLAALREVSEQDAAGACNGFLR